MYCIHIYIRKSFIYRNMYTSINTSCCIYVYWAGGAKPTIQAFWSSFANKHVLFLNLCIWRSRLGVNIKKTHKSASDYHQIGPNGFCKPWKINSSLFSTPSQNAMPLLSCCPCRISSAVVLLGHILGFAWGTLETMVNLQETSHICPIFSWLVDFAIDRQRIRILKYLTKIDPI
jgi:hypothetical protein